MQETSRRPGVRDLLIFALPALILIAGGFYIATKFVEPPPGNTITIAAASMGSPYYMLAEQFQVLERAAGLADRQRDAVLGQLGLVARETSGSFENLKLLGDKASGVGIAFLQGGITNSQSAPNLRSLGRVMYEPLWVFVNADVKIERLADLKGKRVLVGPAGGGTNSLALRMLEANDVTAANTTLVTMELPDYCKNPSRSHKGHEETLVVVGICPHLGCSPSSKFTPGAQTSLPDDWTGGFLCPCHGSTFDLAGRVFKNKPAPNNLDVPRHMYLSDTKILIGKDEKGEA